MTCLRIALFALLAAIAGIAVADGSTSLVITEFMASNDSSLADGDGEYSDWIEIHNPTSASVSLAGCYLTDNADKLTKWQFPSVSAASVAAGGYMIVFASGKGDGVTYVDSKNYIHTSFKLSADGESVVLTASDGSTIISSYIDYPEQSSDVSYGVGSNSITGYMKTPTPGAANSQAGDNPYVADTSFSVKRGFYSSPFSVEISCATSGASIRYTLDCSTPTSVSGTLYTGAIAISGTTVLRAIAYKDGYKPTDVDTQTYIFIKNTINQPSTKPNSLWPDPTSSTSSGGGNPPGGGGGGGGGSSSSQVIDYGMDTDVTSSTAYKSLMEGSLLAIPSISIVTDVSNLFNSSTGIYMNPTEDGDDWEKPACIELINPDGSTGFHANCGIRIRGASTSTKTNPKHSFRVIMRSDYGDDKIEYPLLGENGPTEFDKFDLRTAQNFSWHYSSAQYCTWLDDPFSHDTFRDMGHLSTEGNFYHLYLDGEYWGLYNIEERATADFAYEHLGDDKDNYDAVKADSDTGEMYAVDGSTDLYNAYWTLANAGVSTTAAYYKLQGMNADGTTNTTYTRYMDPDNLVDYMLLVFYSGAYDMPLGPPGSNTMPRNLNAIINRAAPAGFFYLPHDNEWSLMQQYGVSVNRVTVSLGSTLAQQKFFNPWWLHKQLTSNTEYKMRFADRVHKHLFNKGALTVTSCTARYQSRIDEIDQAVIAESARWGDYLTPSSPRTRNTDWVAAITWVRDTFLAQRTAILLSQLQSAGLYPTVAAPELSQNGGEVESGASLSITAAAGTIYYTTDGSDPRMIGGSINSGALSGSSGLTLALTKSATVKARAYSGSVWSALTEANFTVNEADNGGETGNSARQWRNYR